GLHDYLHWGLFQRVLWPAFIGSLFLAIPSAVVVYLVMRMLISRARSPQASARGLRQAGGATLFLLRRHGSCSKSAKRLALCPSRPDAASTNSYETSYRYRFKPSASLML